MRIEIPSLRHNMEYLRLSYPSHELERTISHSNLTIYKHWNEGKNTLKVYKWILQIVIAKNVSITCIFNQRNLFFRLFLRYSNVHKKQIFKCLFKIPLWSKTDNTTFYLLTVLAKIWSENSTCILIHPGMIYLWIWLFGGTAYQGEEEAEAGKVGVDEQPLSDKPPLIRCGKTYSSCQ